MQDLIPLIGLKNIGPTIAKHLAEVGVRTVGDLKSVGVANTYKRVRANHPEVTIPVCYYLYSLQGALDGVHWDDLPSEVKAKLLAETSFKD